MYIYIFIYTLGGWDHNRYNIKGSLLYPLASEASCSGTISLRPKVIRTACRAHEPVSMLLVLGCLGALVSSPIVEALV